MGARPAYLKRSGIPMPPRFVTLIIVAFWLATTAWLVQRDVWPQFQAVEAPPFTIDLVDEAQRQATPVRWSISRGGKPIGRARTWVVYREADDTFALHNEITKLQLAHGVSVPRMVTVYRVTRAGELRSMTAQVRTAVPLLGDLEAHLEGEVRDRKFTGVGRIERNGKSLHDMTLGPVDVPAGSGVLNPLHPVNRLAGLRPDQRWRVPLMNPLTDSLAQAGGGQALSGPRFLDAHVLPLPRNLDWNGQIVPCLVVEYRGDQELSARTWVRQEDGLVLRHEAALGDELLVLERE